MQQKRRILLIDTSGILYSAKYSLGKKKLSHNKIATGIIYGFLLKLQLLIRTAHPDLVVFALDSKQSKRKDMYPNYKENRKANKTPQEIKFDQIAYDQFNIITQYVLPTLGYRNNFKVKGLEADDIIASICKTYSDKGFEIIIASNDGDLYQLLSKNIAMLTISKNRFFKKSDFIAKYGIQPRFWKHIKAICGCQSDNVKGIYMVGEIKAIKYYKNELPIHHKSFQSIVSSKGQSIIKRNKKLVHLPFAGTPKFKLKSNRVTKSKIKIIAKEFNIQSILHDIDTWYYKLRG